MADIVLTTLNAKYIHAAFGLRYLLANLGELKSHACIAEFDINQRPLDIAEALLSRNPKIIGVGIYIWNVEPTTEVIAAIKRVRPEIKIILGGPEVSYETEQQQIVQLADHVITGEADLKFAEVCRVLLNREALFGRFRQPLYEPGSSGRNSAPSKIHNSESRPTSAAAVEAGNASFLLPKIIPAELPDFSRLILPYDLYTDEDIAHRIIYVEASRGCPFTCEFCLSSLDIPVRQAPLPALLDQLQHLLDRGVKQFKFVDRTFNLNVNVSKSILEFFLARYRPGLFSSGTAQALLHSVSAPKDRLETGKEGTCSPVPGKKETSHFFHFEMIPDRLPAALREIIATFPPGVLQFEVGIQTFNEQVAAGIKRRQNYERLADNLHFLRHETGVYIHADLIAGLPGETLESFAAGFDRLIALGPQEIQVGILKRLRGTPIVRHDAGWQMVYNSHPPYEILQNKLIDFAAMQKLRRFARYWDLVGNSGNFIETTPLIWGSGARPFAASQALPRNEGITEAVTSGKQQGIDGAMPPRDGESPASPSPFYRFIQFSEWLFQRTGRTDSIALMRLMELLFEFLTLELATDARPVAETMWRDYQRGGRHDKPGFLKDYLPTEEKVPLVRAKSTLPKRQARRIP